MANWSIDLSPIAQVWDWVEQKQRQKQADAALQNLAGIVQKGDVVTQQKTDAQPAWTPQAPTTDFLSASLMQQQPQIPQIPTPQQYNVTETRTPYQESPEYKAALWKLAQHYPNIMQKLVVPDKEDNLHFVTNPNAEGGYTAVSPKTGKPVYKEAGTPIPKKATEQLAERQLSNVQEQDKWTQTINQLIAQYENPNTSKEMLPGIKQYVRENFGEHPIAAKWLADVEKDSKIPITDFATFYAAGKSEGKSDRQISDDWHKMKVKENEQRISFSASVNQPKENEAVSMAESVANGLLAPKDISKRGKTQAAVFSEVRKIYPNFNFMKANANYAYMTNASNLRAMGLVKATIPRIDDLENFVDKMKNAGPQFINYPVNQLSKVVGKDTVTNFESLRNAIIQEVNTALSGTSTQSDYRIKIEMENLSSSRSPQQLKGAIMNLRSALEARAEASTAVPYSWDEVKGLAPSPKGRNSEQPKGKQGGTSGKAMTYNPATGRIE